MELHWQILDDEEKLAIIAPGIWLKFIKRDSGNYKYISLIMYSIYNGDCSLVDFGGSDDDTKLQLREEYCMKYASIVANSYLSQQHPYRDLPKNL